MPRDPGIYVEIFIQGSIDDVWRLTQDPALHQRWDLRFSTIQYLPRESPQLPQRFLYSTRIGGGMTIDGEGESVGEHLSGGARTSALKFWSDDPRSLIREGSGYWQYLPRESGVTFLTWYDYQTRFGAAGRFVDRWFFRPALGWATAWSFDRLRLWIEKGLDPSAALQRSIVHAAMLLVLLAIAGVAAVSPRSLTGALNPVILIVCVVALALVAFVITLRDRPSARRCARSKETA